MEGGRNEQLWKTSAKRLAHNTERREKENSGSWIRTGQKEKGKDPGKAVLGKSLVEKLKKYDVVKITVRPWHGCLGIRILRRMIKETESERKRTRVSSISGGGKSDNMSWGKVTLASSSSKKKSNRWKNISAKLEEEDVLELRKGKT